MDCYYRGGKCKADTLDGPIEVYIVNRETKRLDFAGYIIPRRLALLLQRKVYEVDIWRPSETPLPGYVEIPADFLKELEGAWEGVI